MRPSSCGRSLRRSRETAATRSTTSGRRHRRRAGVASGAASVCSGNLANRRRALERPSRSRGRSSMLSRIRSRLTYANVVATLSLFLVLSGGTAVALKGSNTVFSDDIVDNQVKSVDVRNDTLTGRDVKESSLGRVPQARNAGTLDGLNSTRFGVGVMGGLMKN